MAVPDSLLRAAALADLYMGGHLTDERGRAAIEVRHPCHDPALDALLEEIAGSKPRTWQSWVDRRQRAARSAARQQLSDRGWVRLQPHRVLGLFPTTKGDHPRHPPEYQAAAFGSMPVARRRGSSG